MKFQHIVAVYTKTLREFRRQKLGFVLTIAFPIFFFFIFGIAFGVGENEILTFQMGIINNDSGIIGQKAFSENFIDLLENITYPDSEQKIFDVKIYEDENNLSENLRIQETEIGILLPEDFSFTLLAAYNQSFYFNNNRFLRFSDIDINESNNPIISLFSDKFTILYNSKVDIIGDSTLITYQIARDVFKTILTEYKKLIGRIPFLSETKVNLESINTQELSIFDTIAPGLFAFSVILQMSMLGSFLANEYENKTINRFIISPLDNLSFLVSLTLYQLTITTVQFPFMIIGAEFFGFKPNGDYFLAYIVLLVTTLSIIGFSFIIAGIISSSDTAGITGGLFSAPIGFASGVFISTPSLVLFQNILPTSTSGFRDFLLFDLLPTNHSVKALKSILLSNAGLSEIYLEIIIALMFSLVFFVLGGLFFTRRRLQRAL